MAKFCPICGKKLGLFSGKVIISNGTVCVTCWGRAGLSLDVKSLASAPLRTLAEVAALIDVGVAQAKAQQAGESLFDSCEEDYYPTEIAEPQKAKVSAPKKNSPTQPAKPIDIFIEVSEKNDVSFSCEGNPMITFDDLLEGKEMVIGDGYVVNASDRVLPEIRIACEFNPPIIEAGLLYYKEGSFSPKTECKIEIDDPPINLTAYAEIKRARKGSVKMTLFIGEEEIASAECKMQVKAPPAKKMEALMQAVMYEEEKNAPGPANIFLYARDSGTYEIDIMRKPELLYSMYSNDQEQLIDDVFIINDSNKTLKNVRFEATFTSDILSSVSVLLGNVGPGEHVNYEVDDPAIDVQKLQMLTDVETCSATYSLYVGTKKVAEATSSVTICPYDQWNAALVLLPAYMTPNHPDVIDLLHDASHWMLVNGMNPSLEGYQSDAKRVEEMVSGVFNAVKEAHIIYSNPPASFFGPQRIRLCEAVLEQKFATCLDMTVLFASCLESFGLHPVLITAPQHIFAGVWLSEDARLEKPIISDAALIQKFIEEGKLVAIECTEMTLGKECDYEKAKTTANKIIAVLAEHEVDDHACIDVRVVRRMGIRPLPMRAQRRAERSSAREEKRMPLTSEGTQKPSQAFEDTPKTVDTEEPQPITQPTPAEKDEDKAASSASMGGEPFNKAEDAAVYHVENYQIFEGDLGDITPDNFYDKSSKRRIKEAISEIVAVEGPISQPALTRAIVSSTSISRASKQISEYLDKMIVATDVKITRQDGVRFLWSPDSLPTDYVVYRFKEQRSPEDICKHELKNAVCCLIQEHGPLTREEIIRHMVKLFGYSRSSKRIEEGAAAAIKAARELKAIEQGVDKRFKLL